MSTVVLDGGPAWLFILGRLGEIAAVAVFTSLWCFSMDRALKACDYSSRKMGVGQPWLIFIPLFGFIWQFVAINKVSISLATEYHFRGWKSDEGKPGIEAGVTACVVIVVVFLLRVLWRDMNPGLAFFTSIGICICMYLHRERLNAFTERLETEQKKIQAQFNYTAGPNPFAQMLSQPAQHDFSQQPGYPQYINAPAPPPLYTSNPHLASFQQTQQSAWYNQHSHDLYSQQKNMQTEQQRQESQRQGGWDGVTTWEAPPGWRQPDLTNPEAYFS